MNVGDLVVKLRADLRNFTAGMAKATATVKTFASRTAAIVRQLHHTMTRWARRIGIALAAGITASIRELAKFEEAMANVSTMLSDQYMYLMPKYGHEIRRMSVEFGESTSTIAFGMYQLLSASMAPEKALNILNASMIAARAGMTDTATAAHAIANALNAYGYQSKYAGLISDRLFSIVRRGVTTFGELASSLGTILPNAALVGARFELIGGALSTATRSGVSMATAVQDLNFLITSFLKPSDKAAEAAKKFDIELNAAALQGEGLLTVLAKLRGENSRHIKATAEDIAVIGQRRGGMRALSIMIQKSTEVERDYRESLEQTGITKEQLGKVADNLMLKLRKFWYLLKDIMVEAVQPFSDDLKALIDWTVKHREEIIKWINTVMSRLDAFVAYLRTGFALGAKVGFDMLKEIARTTGEALLIIFEETFVTIGKSIAGWIWKGIKLSRATAMAMWKKVGMEIAKGINEGISAVLTRIFGPDEERFGYQLPGYGETEVSQLSARLDALYGGLAARLEAIRTQATKVNPELQEMTEWAKKVGGAFADSFKTIYDGLTDVGSVLPEKKGIGDKPTKDMKDITKKWEAMWADASGAIAGAMETAFADIVEDARNATEAIENMLRSIQRAISQAFFQQYLGEPIFAAISKLPGISLTWPSERTPGTREAEHDSRGGMVYAQRGLFVPKGSDTVPAMLTPGEGVLDRETTSRLRRILSVSEPQPAPARVVNINVQAIDAAGTYQFFQRNKRNIASLLGDVQSTNHPIRRSGR